MGVLRGGAEVGEEVSGLGKEACRILALFCLPVIPVKIFYDKKRN